MSPFTILRIAARNIVRNRRRSLISLLAMFLALSIMVLMRGFNNSINRYLRDTIVDVHVGALQIHRKGFQGSIVATPLDLDLPADDVFLARLRAVPHVRAVAARIPSGVVANAHDRSIFAAVVALDPIEERKVCPRRFVELKEGSPVGPEHDQGAALTQLLLSRVGAKLGERVALLGSDRDGVMNAVEIEVRGVLKDAGLMAAEKKLAYIPLASAQELLRMPGRALELAVGIDDLDRVDEVATGLRSVLGPDFEVATFHDIARFDREASQGRESGNWITYVFLCVALLGIANTMLMSVRERTREIGTMLAIGARRRHVLSLFLTESALLGLLGGLLGILLGGLLVYHLGRVGLRLPDPDGVRINEFHPYVGLSYLIQVLLLSVLGATLAALYPARRASKLRPSEALSQVST